MFSYPFMVSDYIGRYSDAVLVLNIVHTQAIDLSARSLQTIDDSVSLHCQRMSSLLIRLWLSEALRMPVVSWGRWLKS